ncbi:hypothetical protein [Halomonas stenophila]|uniref:Uncharacterized protein n=1 Tax=Halomonas stenophila TaxID=795312 RepID=A0A7W5HLN5_9GAMM|nr:hypothetical protein [Halomonas stenophila]MBB3231732.1 hypothetical protein [Halomonas stenophila]
MSIYSNPAVEHYADRFMLLGLARAGINLLQYFANPKRCEAWARYQQLRLERHGFSFDQYLADPELGEERALEPEPPLQAQHAAILRLWAGQDTGLAPRGHEEGAATLPAGYPPHPEDYQDWRELLAQWRAEAEHAERPLAHLPQRNGAYVEPLHHHRHCRSAAANFAKRGA